MNPVYALSLIFTILFIVILLEVFVYIFYKVIYTPHKVRSATISLQELLIVLNTVIRTEIELYEKNIFSTKGALTNANFDNFYNDITNNIIESLSDDFFFRIRFFMKEEAIVSIICRNVRDYLVEKVNTVQL